MSTIAKFMKNYGDAAFKLVVLLGIMGQIWLTQNFVTRKEYREDAIANSTAHLALQTSLNDIATTVRIMATTSSRVDDHESRMRTVEQKQIDNTARISALERETVLRIH